MTYLKCSLMHIGKSYANVKLIATRTLFSFSSEILNNNKRMSNIKDTQNKNKKLREKSSRYPPGTINLQVLGSGALGAPRALYLFTDQTRYLFNCGEGTQRLAHEHKAKLAKLDHVLITQSSWRNIGGLPGLALTIQDSGVQNIVLHGPSSSSHLFEAARRFVHLNELSVQQAPCVEGGEFTDNVLTLTYAHVHPSCIKKNNTTSTLVEEEDEDETDYYAHEKKDGNKKKRSLNQTLTKHKKPRLGFSNLSIQHQVCVSYIIRFHSLPGTLCIEKCVNKGVPPGPLLGKLKSGENITLPDGKVILAEEVRMPNKVGPVILVVECPSLDYLDSFIEQPLLRRHNSSASQEIDSAYLVAHFTPVEVYQHPKYQAWIEDFSPSTKHLIVNESNICLGSEAVHRVQYKLNLLDPRIFPLLYKAEHNEKNKQIIQASTMMQCQLRPLKGFTNENCIKIKGEEYISEALEVEGLSEELKKLKSTMDSSNDQKNEYPKITFLGTGSCIPNKTRNTSAILLYTSPNSSLLLDCGEGTFGQLTRFYGTDLIPKILQDIKGVFISHLHADHHMGLMGLLHEWKKISSSQTRPLILFAPKQILGWLIQYNNVFEPILDSLELVHNTDLLDEGNSRKDILDYLHLTSLQTCPVRHCAHSFGISLKHQNNWKLTYSGDTMPCDNLIKIGKNSDILIHEATMEDELEEEAAFKMHCTMSQALEVGKKMNARYTLLTHFSQRYAKLPRINGNDLPSNVGIAFDNMEVSLKDLSLLHLFQPSLKLIFHEHCEILDNKALKRFYRKQHMENSEENKKQVNVKINRS